MTQEFLNEAKLPFKECTREEQHILLDAWLDGRADFWWPAYERWQFMNEVMPSDTLKTDNIYRTKPVKRLAIPWENIKPEYRWAAMDEDGEVYIYDTQPTIYERADGWKDNGDCRVVDFLSNIDTSGISWRDSLVERPAEVK